MVFRSVQALSPVLSQHPLARGGIPAVEQPDAVKVVQEKADTFWKRAGLSSEIGKLGGDPKQTIDQLDLGENVALFRPFHLPFSDHVHRLVAGQCALRRLEGKETQAGPGAAFDEAVVLFDQIIEVFDLAQLAIGRELLVGFERFHGLWVSRVLIDVDHARRDRMRRSKRFLKEALGGHRISSGAEEERDGLPVAIHRPVVIQPFAFNLDIRLVHFPRVVGRL